MALSIVMEILLLIILLARILIFDNNIVAILCSMWFLIITLIHFSSQK